MVNWTELQEVAASALLTLRTEITSSWFYLQIGIILCAAGLAHLASKLIRSRIDRGAVGAGLPAPLRLMLRVFIRNLATALFVVLLFVARAIMLAVTWPSHSYLLGVAMALALTWLIMRCITSVMHDGLAVRLISLTAWGIAALGILGLLEPAISTLDSFAITLGGLRLTPLLVIKVAVLLTIALWLAGIAGKFVEARIAASGDLTPSMQVLIAKLVRISLMSVAVIVALGSVGIDLSVLTLFGGAIGVGLGFGLQKIVGNFISGIILLADKSVKPGDLVTIGDNSGRISAMNTRYISVAAGDGREFLIPNEDLITQKVVNWTYSDKNTLVKVNFATNYDADPRLVCKLAIEIAAAAPRAIKLKAPNCLLTEFAETGMKFSLTFWIPEPDGMDAVRSGVMMELWDAFKREGIRVPYPVREIRVRGGALPVEAMVETSAEQAAPDKS
jgi:small-conductance mechanosensitive channel